MSATSDVPLDFDLLKKALNICTQRNDCVRLRFCKKDGKIMQYFLDEYEYKDVPLIGFASEAEQNKFIQKETSKPIKYMKGEVLKPFFCKTFDGKDMILVKVCHLNFDIYGLNIFFKDLFGVYEGLKNNTEFPTPPTKFEDVIIKDVATKNNQNITERNKKFFEELTKANEEPYYAGLHGWNSKYWQKYLKKGKKYISTFFINNQTKGYMYTIPSDIVAKIMDYCQQTKTSPSNYFFYACSVCASKINNDVKTMLPLELCNCRGTMLEKNCAGTKVQSMKGCYTVVEQDKTFEESLNYFCSTQKGLFRYLDYPDIDYQMLRGKIYGVSPIAMYYSITFSFIPYIKPENINFQVYSNGRCALPAYLGLMYDVDTQQIDMAYDVQTKIISEDDVKNYHNNYLKILAQVVENPQILIKDIKL